MSKKQDAFYFDNFIACAELSSKAAHQLKKALTVFNPEKISEQFEALHEIERKADEERHVLTDKVAKAFITPIEREDIVTLSHYIDEVTDKIEEVLIRIYVNNIQAMRPEALEMLDTVIRCCDEMMNLMKEFSDFRHSNKLRPTIININSLEEDADKMYISNLRKLHTEEKDVLQIIAWREIYDYMEKCADACEHVADTVGSIVMTNS